MWIMIVFAAQTIYPDHREFVHRHQCVVAAQQIRRSGRRAMCILSRGTLINAQVTPIDPTDDDSHDVLHQLFADQESQ